MDARKGVLKGMDKQLKTWVEGAIAGNQKELEKLLQHFMKDILYFAMVRLSRQEAEDVAQEVALTIVKEIHKLRDPERFTHWLSVIVQNESINHLRRFHKTTTVDLDDVNADLLQTDSENVAHMEFLPDQYSENAELRAVLLEEINRLPGNQRVCLAYHYLYDFKRQDIAEITGLSPRQVSTGLNYGKKTLKARLEKRLHTNFVFSVVPAGVTPVLAQMFLADQAAAVPAAWSAQVVSASLQCLPPVPVSGFLKGTAAKIAAGVSAGAAAAGVIIGVALQAAPPPAPAAVPPPTPAPIAAQVQEPEAPPEEPQPTEKPILTLEDMIGAGAAARLEALVTGSVQRAQWEEFLNEIGAEAVETAADYDSSYTISILEKQEKRLFLAECRQLESDTVSAFYIFDSRNTELMKMTQVILTFDLEGSE